MATVCPRFEKVLIHSAIMDQVSEFLRQNGLHLNPVNDIREGHAHILTITPRGARTIRGH